MNDPQTYTPVAAATLASDLASILIVDDVPANLELLAGMLRKRGLEPRLVPSGKLALQAAQADPPDLVLLDIHMPEMDGYEVCRRLKADARLKSIPVLFISALTDIDDKVKGFEAGGLDYITKPFQIEEVQARVDTHLELHRNRRELQNAYLKLRQMESLRDSLVHMLIHDMRSPLSVITTGLELALDPPLPAEADQLITSARASTHQLINMVSSVLDVSKMEAEKMNLDISRVDMMNLVNESVAMIEPLRGKRQITISSSATAEVRMCDSGLIHRVVQNLLHNALKCTRFSTGMITVGIGKTSEGNVRVTVADNGPGIPPEYREKIFDKFCQVEARKKAGVPSTGYGLTFCKMAVEAHGGRIGVESEVGGGSTFWFELP